ncbi:hypothetical protein J0835_16330 [Bacillus cereus group sp. Sample62]|uniref:hypothetical protein n=1 Tax=Bacillus TaxID=1386 RepID=UPI000B42ED99|nr:MULTISPECIES: hypothetical protein [Bacillus cereus group]MCH4568387.1 hypothetical protein [Bacillus sp. ES1-5]HDR4723522.1 hypothetical protein [Bacillus cereus]HDX9549042.1 hypothetical protein [Bacillus thuringiensis]
MKEKAKITKNIAKSYSKIAAKIEKSKWHCKRKQESSTKYRRHFSTSGKNSHIKKSASKNMSNSKRTNQKKSTNKMWLNGHLFSGLFAI